MVQFTAKIMQAETHPDKTGWTFILIPADIAAELNPGVRKSYRVKGKLDKHSVKGLSLLPMGSGTFMLPLSAELRKAIHKKKGAMLDLRLSVDKEQYQLNTELVECLADEPVADARFRKMPTSHQHYFSKWIESAKTEPTRTKRIAQTVNAMLRGITNFGEVMRSLRKE